MTDSFGSFFSFLNEISPSCLMSDDDGSSLLLWTALGLLRDVPKRTGLELDLVDLS